MRKLKIIAHLLENNTVEEDIIEYLYLSELEYFNMMNKCKALEIKVDIDTKTGLLKYDSKHFIKIVKEASRLYQNINKTDFTISLIRFDIDDFSHFNDTYGHKTGDEVLRKVAAVLVENSRPTDYVIRFGGEEFDIILPSTDTSGAHVFIEKLYGHFNSFKNDSTDLPEPVTISAGLSSTEYIFNGNSILEDKEILSHYAALQEEADDALYEAKFLGKDRYAIFDKQKKEYYTELRYNYSQKKNNKAS